MYFKKYIKQTQNDYQGDGQTDKKVTMDLKQYHLWMYKRIIKCVYKPQILLFVSKLS
jgi:hypothetical protein